MTTLRIFGLIVGLMGFLFVFARFRKARINRFDFLWGVLFSLSLVTVSLFPNSVNFLRDLFSLEKQQLGRLIAISIISNILLWFLLLYSRSRWTSYADQFDHLIRRLGVAEFEHQHPNLEKIAAIVVIIPAFNEEKNIPLVLEKMPKEVCGLDLVTLVVDDGSTDKTLEVARNSGSLVIRSPMNRGGGAALRMGFDIAHEYGADIVVTMDADGQHLPAEMERLVKPILQGDSDFVIGSRILGEREHDSPVRYIGIHVFNALIRLLTPAKISDCSNGFRAFKEQKLSQVLLRQDQFHTSELIIDAARKGIRISEAPITVKRRHSGKSKKGTNFRYGLMFAKTILKTWWR